jgi:hypothetical protein
VNEGVVPFREPISAEIPFVRVKRWWADDFCVYWHNRKQRQSQEEPMKRANIWCSVINSEIKAGVIRKQSVTGGHTLPVLIHASQ